MSNFLQNKSLIAFVIGLLLWNPFVSFGQIPTKEEARAAKLTPDLFALQQQQAEQKSGTQNTKSLRQAADEATELIKVNRLRIYNGMVAIEAIANDLDGQGLLTDLQALGLTDGQYFQRIVSGYFPIEKLDILKNVAKLHVARPSYAPIKQIGRTTSQGDSVMRADRARRNFGVDGTGTKVGVLSDSYDALKGAAAGVASNDLPPNVQVLVDIPAQYASDASDEGRAMAEIVHDVAPGAAIAFNTAYESQVGFALGIMNLAKAGCNIIVDDVFYYAEPFFQDGIIAQAVDFVKKMNVTYFSSAGNQARDSYTSPFINSGRITPGLPNFPITGSAHDFGGGRITQRVTIAPGSTFSCIFQWSDPFYSTSTQTGGVSGAKTDMDLLVYVNGVLQPQLSSAEDNLGDDPIEGTFITNTSRTTPLVLEIALVKYAGPDPALIKWINFGNGDTGAKAEFITNSSTTVGHANAAGAIAVGAVPWYQTPAYSPSRYPFPIIESFSSAGGTPILFTTYGQPIPAVVRLKPEISAPDGGNTTFFGQQLNDGDTFPNFFGTSAAAPHAAAVGALLQQRAANKLSPDEVLKRLETTAIDMDDPLTPGFDTGFDFRTGFGFIQADKALMYGQSLALIEPLFDCQTRLLTLQTTGGDGTPITFSVPGVQRSSPTSTTGIVEAGVIADAKPIVITATQSGVTTTYTFNFVEYCARPKAFTLVAPLYNCATAQITFQTQGGNGTPITYSAPGVKRDSPTSPTGVVEAGLLYDPKPLTITATQSGVTATYVFNFVAFCSNRARLAASESGTDLQVTVLGNPNPNQWVTVEVRGVAGQALGLQVSNSLGELSSRQWVEQAGVLERRQVLVGPSPGLYFLKVSTPSQTKTVKIIRQQ